MVAKSSDGERDLHKVWQLRVYITTDRCTVLCKKVIKLGNEEGKIKLRKKNWLLTNLFLFFLTFSSVPANSYFRISVCIVVREFQTVF